MGLVKKLNPTEHLQDELEGMLNSCQTSLADFRSADSTLKVDLLDCCEKNVESSRSNLMEAMMFVQMDTMIEGLYFIIHRPQDDIRVFSFFHSSLVSVSCFVNTGIIFPNSLCRCCSEHNLTGPLKHPSLSMPLTGICF